MQYFKELEREHYRKETGKVLRFLLGLVGIVAATTSETEAKRHDQKEKALHKTKKLVHERVKGERRIRMISMRILRSARDHP